MPTSSRTLDLLRDYISEHCGISLGTEKNYLIESRLAKLLVETGSPDFESFYHKAKSEKTGSLRDKIVDAVTTNETLWFRDENVWNAIGDVMLSRLCGELKEGRRHRARIWSAACSTGQEPYSMAILIDELLKTPSFKTVRPAAFEILGTDVSDTALLIASAGRYNQIAMSRGLSDARKARYFAGSQPVWELRKDLRNRVAFLKNNLLKSFAGLGQFDLVLLRNVAIYFSETLKKDLFGRISKAIAPGGYLVLGASEAVSDYSSEFKMVEHKKAIYYQIAQRGKSV
jgi:chemotaxis protein methyltransferase CheR